MYFDAFTISALVDEFMDTIVGGRVQDVIDVDDTGLGLEIYANQRRHYLYLSADHMVPRVHVTQEKLRRGRIKPTNLGLMMRRYVESGQLVHVSQPAYERVIHFHIEGPEGEIELIAEPMERRSNLLLVQGGVILDCLRRIGPQENRYRLSLPAHEYMPPPPQTGKLSPERLTPADLEGFFEQVQDPRRKSIQVLSTSILGMSPLLAREIVYRASGDAQQLAENADTDAIFEQLREIMEPLFDRQWQPGVVENDADGVRAFSMTPISYIESWAPTETMSEAIVAYYGAPIGEDAYKAAKKPVQEAIEEAYARNRAKLNSLKDSFKDDAEREVLRQSGELILAYQYTLEKGQTELRAQYDMDGPELSIQLDPNLSPLDNAQRYFTRYNKAKRALDDVPRLIEETETELAWIAQLESDLEMATNWPDIDEVRQALQSSGYWQGKKLKRVGGGGQSAPLRVVTPDGFVIWIGRNSRQNELVTFKKASAEDFWLHARNVPGAHVIIKNDGRRIPDAVMQGAAALAAHYSKLRGEGSVQVDFTRIKYVRKIRGAARGMVTYRNEQTLLVQPRDEQIFAKDTQE